MFLLGHTAQGKVAGELEVTLPDGRIVGPFESARAVDAFERFYSRMYNRFATAKDIFEGSVEGDSYQIFRTDEVALEMHPFSEIYDVWTQADNGNVVFETPYGFSVHDPMRMVVVDYPFTRLPTRKLETPSPAPRNFDIEPSDMIEAVLPSRWRGEVVVIWKGHGSPNPFLVGWREDGRQKKEIAGLSVHQHIKVACKVATDLAFEFRPPERIARNRPRDVQKARLYTWEHSFDKKVETFNSLDEAADFAAEICRRLGERPPRLRMGRPTLLYHSYYKAGEITLSAGMLDSHTIVHEVAHHIVRDTVKEREASHGSKFAGVMLALMTEFLDADIDQALDNARSADVVVDLDTVRTISSKLAISLKADQERLLSVR